MRLNKTKFHTLMAVAACALMQFSAHAQAPAPAPGNFPAGGPPPSGGRAGGPTVLGAKVADAKPHEIRVIATGSILSSLQSVGADADKAVGKHLVIEYGTARGSLRDQILNGQDFELAILVPDVNDELVKKGLAKSTRYEIARIPVGIGYTGAGTPPDISTPTALKKALLEAKLVTFAAEGMGGQAGTKILEGLGIKDQVKLSTTGRGGNAGGGAGPGGPGGPGAPGGAGGAPRGNGGAGGGGFVQGPALAPGEYTLSIAPASEILANKNAKYLGPVIDEYQALQILEAVVGAHARDEKSTKKFVDYLRGPEFGAVLKRNGFTTGK
jgi:ABC-type molybdate transport system substrate-binding protein